MDNDDGIPRVVDPEYMQSQYLLMLAEVEDLFGQLRNADNEERLEMIEYALSQSDGWLDHYYRMIGVDNDMRTQAAQFEMAIIERLKELFNNPDRPDFDV